MADRVGMIEESMPGVFPPHAQSSAASAASARYRSAPLPLAGAVLCAGVVVIHVIDQGGPTALKTPAYIGYLYYVLEISGVLAVLGLLTRRAVLAGWVIALGIATGPIVGYVLARSVGLPGSTDDIGNWTEPLGVASLAVEGLLLVGALTALAAVRTRRPAVVPDRAGAGWQQGNDEQAGERYRRALAVARAAGDEATEARALLNLGNLDRRQGRSEQAGERYWRALAVARAAGDRATEARALLNLGSVDRRHRHERALTRFREIGDRVGEARALLNLGNVEGWQGHHQQAAEHHRQALALFREMGDRHGESCVLNRAGETLRHPRCR